MTISLVFGFVVNDENEEYDSSMISIILQLLIILFGRNIPYKLSKFRITTRMKKDIDI